MLYTRQALERAVQLVEAYLGDADPADQAPLVAALEETFAAANGNAAHQRELIASLAALAGRAAQTAASLTLVMSGRDREAELLREEGKTVVTDCVAALHEERKAVDRRSDLDRRITPDRRSSHDDSAAARVNRWLHGDRRSGDERRSGTDRREAPPPFGQV